jgi:hypothetical protein
MRLLFFRFTIVLFLSVSLSSCGAGGSSTLPPATAGGTGAIASGNLLLPLGGGSAQLPPFENLTASVFVPLNANGSEPAAADASVSATSPDPAAFSETSPNLNVPRTPIEFVVIRPKTMEHLPGLPGFDFPLPARVSTAGKQFFVAFFDGHTVKYAAEGPGMVNGRHVTFPPTPPPVTLYAGVTYTFTLYSQPIVYPITTTPPALSLLPGGSGTFTVAEKNYNQSFSLGTCTSSGKTLATVSFLGGNRGPSATVKVSAAASLSHLPGACTIAIGDQYGQTAGESVTIGYPPLTVSTPSLMLTGNGAGSFTVSEGQYSGNFTVGTCESNSRTIATAAPSVVPGPSGLVTVTPASAGSCNLSVTDSHGQSASVAVSVVLSPLTVSASSVQFPAAGAAAIPQTLTLAEANDTGSFNVTPCVAGSTPLAQILPGSISGPSALLTISALLVGTCNVMVSDTLGQSTTFAISITTGTINLQ